MIIYGCGAWDSDMFTSKKKKKKKKTTSEKTLIYSVPLAFTFPAQLTCANQTIQHWQGC